jgi:hypothetical protein
MKLLLRFACIALLLIGISMAQEPGHKVPSVELAPVGKVQVKPGGSAAVPLDFRVGSEFHINSNHPHSELLIPTVLKLNSGAPIAIVGVKYPAGEDVAFAFSQGEKLSVYSGDFSIVATVKAAPTATGGTYPVEGELHFQACDRSACYPPKSIPVKFSVMVAGK